MSRCQCFFLVISLKFEVYSEGRGSDSPLFPFPLLPHMAEESIGDVGEQDVEEGYLDSPLEGRLFEHRHICVLGVEVSHVTALEGLVQGKD